MDYLAKLFVDIGSLILQCLHRMVVLTVQSVRRKGVGD